MQPHSWGRRSLSLKLVDARFAMVVVDLERRKVSELIYRLVPEDLRFKEAKVVDSSMTIVLCEAVDLIHVFADIALI